MGLKLIGGINDELLAKQYHSITIGEKNTWLDFRLIPASRPSIAPPSVKTNYVTVPGADGELDFTEALDQKIHYGMREGSWEFYVCHELIDKYNWIELWDELLDAWHGKRQQIILMDEAEVYPGEYWAGRIALNEFQSDAHHSKVVIDYRIDPFRSADGAMKETFK